MGDLRDAVIHSPALKPLDYESDSPVILAVDTSYIAIGYFLCQCSPEDVKCQNYSRFGSITLNKREARFSQAKLEIYGLFRALRTTRLWIIGVRKLVVETDARYIKGMLANLDIQPSASINHWILSILTFHFELVHVKETFHRPDGLSRRPRQPDDPIMDDDDFILTIGLIIYMDLYCYAPFCLASQTPRRFRGELKTGIHETTHTRMVFTQHSPAQEIIGEHRRTF